MPTFFKIFLLSLLLTGCYETPAIAPEYKHYSIQDIKRDLDTLEGIKRKCPDLTLDVEEVAIPIRARYYKMYVEKRWAELPHGSVAAPEGTAFHSRIDEDVSSDYYRK